MSILQACHFLCLEDNDNNAHKDKIIVGSCVGGAGVIVIAIIIIVIVVYCRRRGNNHGEYSNLYAPLL